MNGDSRPLPKEKRTRSQAARDSTIETHGKLAAVVRAAKDAARSLSALIAAVDAYEGKPAFPVVATSFSNGCWGLTKRELFAAMAMQDSLAGEPGSHLGFNQLAQDSVAYADALLKELSK